MNYRELHRLYELDGAQATIERMSEALAAKELAPEDFSLRDLAEAVVPDGREWVRSLNPRGGFEVTEADGVDVTAFTNITGQILYNKILDSYQHESNVLSRAVATIPTKFDGEKIPGAASLPESSQIVPPGMPFPSYGFGERYVETPATTKRGFIVPVTKEAIFFDRTMLVLQRASEVGESLGVNKEKWIADMVCGASDIYSENGSSGLGTYQTAAPWINDHANPLADWTDVDAAETLLANILDPDTSEPVLIDGNLSIVCGPSLKHKARMILSATQVRNVTTSATVETDSGNPLDDYNLIVSRQFYRRTIADGVTAANAAQYWLLGDLKKAFAYMENWPITVVRAPRNSEADFNSDVVARFKASERGAAAVLNPRYVVRNKN